MTAGSLSAPLLARHPLAELNESKRLPGISYKLADGYGLDVTFTGDLDIDEKKMAVWIVYADGNRRDGVGDLLVVEGIDESRHRKNPIHLFDHGKSVTLPVGKVEDPETGRYTGVIDPVMKVAKDLVYYYQGTGLPGIDKSQEYDHAVFCQQLFDLLAKRYVRGGSIGYQVIQGRELPPEPMYGTPKGLLLLQVLKLESSTVVMPANQDTVRKGLALDIREVLAMPSVCGKPLSPMLVKSLAPFAPEKKAQLGYEGKASSLTERLRRLLLSTSTSGEVNDVRGETSSVIHVLNSDPKIVLRLVTNAGYRGAKLTAGGSVLVPEQKKIQLSYEGTKAEVSPDAATVNARLPYAQAQTRATQQPKMGVRQKPDGYYVYDPSTGQDQFGPFFSEGIALRWAERLNMGKKNVKELRKKYRRTAKGLVRRLRKSSPGSGIVYVSSKDMEEARKQAESKGVKFEHLTSKNGTAKVRLTGDDGLIDELAKGYGRLVKFQGVKSMNTKGIRLRAGQHVQGTYSVPGLGTGEFSGTIQGVHMDTARGGFGQATVKLDKPMKLGSDERTSIMLMVNNRGEFEPDNYTQLKSIQAKAGVGYHGPYVVKQPAGGTAWYVYDANGGNVAGPFQHKPDAEKAAQKWEEVMGKNIKAQPLRTPSRTNVHAGVEESGETVIARRAIMQIQNVYEYFAQPGDRLTVVGRNDVGQMRVRNRAGVEQSVTSIDVRRKAMGMKANPLTLIMVGDEVEVIPGSGGHTQYHGGDRGIVKEVRPSGYVIQIPGEPRPTAFEKDEVKLVRKKSMNTKGFQEKVEEAKTRFRQEGSRGIDWVFDHMSKTERDAFDQYLVQTQHPLAYEPGTQESRFRRYVSSGGKALKDTKSMKHTKKKDGDDLPVGDESTTVSGEERQLPLGAQVLRRIHEDNSLLLQDYDEMLGPLENEAVKARLQRKLEGFTEELTELEEEFGKLYPDLGGLVGTKDDDALEDAADMESDGEPDNDKEEYEEELEATPKDMDTMDDDAVGSSSEEREEVSPEDALEGMEAADEEDEKEGEKSLRRTVKSLRKKYKKKGMCPECGKEDCDCDKTEEKGIKVAPAVAAAVAPAVGQLVGSALTPKDKGYVKEAGGFLGEMGQPDSVLDDEGRMKSYHYHKTLSGMAQLEEARNDLEEGSDDLQDSGIPPAEWEPGVGAKTHRPGPMTSYRRAPSGANDPRGPRRGSGHSPPPKQKTPAPESKAADERQRTDKPKNPDDGNVRDERGYYGRPGKESVQPAHTKPDHKVGQKYEEIEPEDFTPLEEEMETDGKGQMEILGNAASFLKDLAFLPELDDEWRGKCMGYSKDLNDFVGSDEEAPTEEPPVEEGTPEGVVMEEEVPTEEEEEPGMEVKFLAEEATLQNKKITELSRKLSRLPILN